MSTKQVQFFMDGSTTPDGAPETTNSRGVASHTFTIPFASLTPGSHLYTVKFVGDDDDLPSDAGPCTINAPWSTEIVCELPDYIECNQPTTLSVKLRKAEDPGKGDPIALEPVMLAVDNEKPIQVTTDSSGVASIPWTPKTAGAADTHTFHASFAGDINACLCPSSQDCTFTVYVAIQVRKFDDCNMDGVKQESERQLGGWPVVLWKDNSGQLINVATLTTSDSGWVKFGGSSLKLLEGDYAVSEEGTGLVWDKHQTEAGCSWQTNFTEPACPTTNKITKWQATGVTWDANTALFAACSPDSTTILAPKTGTNHVSCVSDVSLGNVELTPVPVFKFHDINMNGKYEANGETYTDLNNNGRWDSAEPFTDVPPCNGVQDGNEFYRDVNNNGKWDAAEPYIDLDKDGQYDWPECPIQGWPFVVSGKSANGSKVCEKGVTDENGLITFYLPPSQTGSPYKAYEDVSWCDVQLGSGTVKRTSYTASPVCPNGMPCTEIDRWQATTPPEQDVTIPCSPCPQALPEIDFGNVCLTTLDVTKEVYDDGMPGQVAPTPPSKWTKDWDISLAGLDHYNRIIQPSSAVCNVLTTPATPPIDLPCQKYPLTWYSINTAQGNISPDGKGKVVRFVDLLPGHYHLAEQPDANYRLSMSEPMLSGFDVLCCPWTAEMQNINKNAHFTVYQVYPGRTNPDLVYTRQNDPVTAVPGVLNIVPGDKCANFKQATQLCRESPIKNTTLTKQTFSAAQCGDVFPTKTINQSGTPNVRTWWPLMYEPPATTWTLNIVSGTLTKVRFPGESLPGYVHQDSWKWVVETDLPHMKLYIDLLRELPFGRDEVPLISDDVLATRLQANLDAVQEAIDNRDTVSAGQMLGNFEMTVMDACIGTSPSHPNPSGVGLGIAETTENPACCKLLVDAEYVGKALGAYQSSH